VIEAFGSEVHILAKCRRLGGARADVKLLRILAKFVVIGQVFHEDILHLDKLVSYHMNMNILIAVVGGFASGVFVRSVFTFGWEFVVFVLLIATLFVGAIFFAEARRGYSLAAVFFIFVALGVARSAIADTPLPDAFMKDLRQRVRYEGIVVADPDIRDSSQRIQVQITRGDDSTDVLAVVPRDAEVMVGDRVRVSGTLLSPEPFSGDNGRVFRYDKYLQRDGVRFLLNYAYIDAKSHAPWYSLSAILANLKQKFTDGIQATLPEPHASLSSGIVIGGKSGLGNELKEDFIRSGLIHMIVLSGHNVMVVASWVIMFFTVLFAKVESIFGKRVPRSVSVGFGVVALILFVGIAGASATSIRAALMALIALYALATGRTYVAGRALLFVILLMLIWNPLYLVFDPGFGLSVVATAGLIWLAPIIEIYLSHIKNKFWNNAIATTLSAQIAVLPLLLYNTGNLSIVAFPANLLVMPFIPLAMGFSAVAGFGGIIFGSTAPATGSSLASFLGYVIAMPAYLINQYLLFVVRESSSLPLAAFTLPSFPFWLTFLAYAGLIYFVRSKRFSTTDQFKFAKKASI
jgi:competence protein ComEC